MSKLKQFDKSLIYFVFVLSGVSGLIYESIWSQYLGLYLGHAAFAQTLTLAIFMGGMALGSWFVSKKINKIKNALLLYAIIELVIGVLGIVFHGIFEFTLSFSFNVLFPNIGDPTIITIAKWLIATLLILPQSILLGSTFPLISAGLIRRVGNSPGKLISILYFSNSIGAAFGALISTFLLLPSIGMPGAITVAGFINIIVAFVIYSTSKKQEPNFVPNNTTNTIKTQYNKNTLFLFIAAITGFSSFIYEIAWIRMLNLVLGTTLHSFEIMLSAFIAGIALGSLWIKNRIDSIPNLIKFLGLIQIAMGILALITMPLYIESFSWVSSILVNLIQKTDVGYSFYNILTGALAILIMVPAAFCAGMTFPLLTKILISKGENEKAIGKIYSSNTIGSLLGVWFAIHIGMVYLGLKYMIVFAASVDMLIGLYLLYQSRPNKGKIINNTLAYSIISVVSVFVLTISFVSFSKTVLVSGTFRTGASKISDNTKVLYYEDGKSSTISIVNSINNDNEELRIISTNGKPDAGILYNTEGNSADEATMVLLGAIPFLIKPNAENIANIGFGSGLTTHTLLSSKKLKELHTIEIEPAMVEGSKHFLPRNQRAYSDPRSKIIFDDAKTFFSSYNKQYDIIVSEPSNPWVLGVGNLFSQEFYSNIKNYLKEDGILVQWLQLYEVSPEVLSTAINALSSEFPYFKGYLANRGDLILIASSKEIPEFQFQKTNMLNSDLINELANINITTIPQIESRKIGDQKLIGPLFRQFNNQTNSDYFPLLTLKAPKDRFKKSRSTHIFKYSNFSTPVFSLLNTQSSINSLLNSDINRDHPFAGNIKSYNTTFNSMKNINSINVNTSNRTLGLLFRYFTPKNFCGISEEKEHLWVTSFIQLYNSVLHLGNEKLNLIFQSKYIQACEKNMKYDVPQSLLQLHYTFAKMSYKDFIKQAVPLLETQSILNKNIKTSILNKYVYSYLKLLESEFLTNRTPIESFITKNKSIWNDETLWLIAQIPEI